MGLSGRDESLMYISSHLECTCVTVTDGRSDIGQRLVPTTTYGHGYRREVKTDVMSTDCLLGLHLSALTYSAQRFFIFNFFTLGRAVD